MIRFERQDLDGIVPAGTYVIDAMKRFGIRPEEACDLAVGEHQCSVVINSGIDLLSDLTAAETEYFANNGRKTNERLACQAKIELPGEVVVMTSKKKESASEAKAETDKSEQYKKEFEELPLEKKIADLVHLEAITLGETFSFVLNSPFKVFDKVLDVMAEFGFKKEEDAHAASRPAEHQDDAGSSETDKKRPRPKRAGSTTSKD
jgi:ferredoxin